MADRTPSAGAAPHGPVRVLGAATVVAVTLLVGASGRVGEPAGATPSRGPVQAGGASVAEGPGAQHAERVAPSAAARLPMISLDGLSVLPRPVPGSSGADALAAVEAALTEVEALLPDGVLPASALEQHGPSGTELLTVSLRRTGTDPWPNGYYPTESMCAPVVAPDALLRCEAAAALDELSAAYREVFGADLDVTSSYRDYAAQVSVKRLRGGLAATPGTSEHGRGLAVDLGGIGGLGEFGSPGYVWLRDNAAAFGWFHPPAMGPGGGGPPEPWHWEYAG